MTTVVNVKITDEMILGRASLAQAYYVQQAKFDLSNINRTGVSVQDITKKTNEIIKKNQNEWAPYLTERTFYVSLAASTCLIVIKILHLQKKIYEFDFLDKCLYVILVLSSILASQSYTQSSRINEKTVEEIKSVYKTQIQELASWRDSHQDLIMEFSKAKRRCSTLLLNSPSLEDKKKIENSIAELDKAIEKDRSNQKIFRSLPYMIREIIFDKEVDCNTDPR